MSTDVTARCRRSGDWWAIETPEIPGLYTQTKRLDQVADMVRDAAETLGVETGDITIEPVMDGETERMLRELFAARDEAAKTQARSSALARETVTALRGEGLTVRDVATLTGVSPQRVSALAHKKGLS